MSTRELLALSSVELRRRIGTKEISPVELLEACIARYGLRHFKLKVTGQISADLERTRKVAETIQRCTDGDFAFSLDGRKK